MNRYIVEGLLRDATTGKRVLVFAAQGGARKIFRHVSVLAANQTGVKRILRANGRECVEFTNGGRLRFISTSHAARGHEADVVYVEAWNDLSDRQREDIAPSALRGELIRA